MSERPTVQGILRRHLDDYLANHPLDARRRAVCQHLIDCHTEVMGGYRLHCDYCAHARTHYFGCRDRHCPGCQHQASEHWQARQQQQTLPVTYFHLVFTLPETLNAWTILHPEVIYRLLFQSAWATLQAFGGHPRRLGGQLGMTAILHTWGQNLSRHPHLHCLVPGGALTANGAWHPAKGRYLFPVRALSRGFRGRMVSALRQAHAAGQLPRLTEPDEPKATLDALMQQAWVVYCRPGMSDPGQVIQYLARYTHRTAISNARLIAAEEGQVTFRYKDYRDGRQKTLTLETTEFIRRFVQHILPKGLMRIRHYGFLTNACRRKRLARIRAALKTLEATAPEPVEPAAFSGYPCPECRQGRMQIIGTCPPHRWEGGG